MGQSPAPRSLGAPVVPPAVAEQTEVHGLGHLLVPGVVGVEVVTAVVRREHPVGLAGSRIALSKSMTASNWPEVRIQSFTASRTGSLSGAK